MLRVQCSLHDRKRVSYVYFHIGMCVKSFYVTLIVMDAIGHTSIRQQKILISLFNRTFIIQTHTHLYQFI